MTWLIESPWPSLMLGVGLEVILAIALVRTGRGAIMVAMAVVLALTVGMLVLERLVVTQTEEVEDALDGVAGSLGSNDAGTVLAGFSPQSPRRAEVKSALASVTINSARVAGDLEIRFNDLTSPPSAVAYFTGIVDAKDNRGAIPYEHMMRKFKVTLRKEGDRWLIYDYAEAEKGRQR